MAINNLAVLSHGIGFGGRARAYNGWVSVVTLAIVSVEAGITAVTEPVAGRADLTEVSGVDIDALAFGITARAVTDGADVPTITIGIISYAITSGDDIIAIAAGILKRTALTAGDDAAGSVTAISKPLGGFSIGFDSGFGVPAPRVGITTTSGDESEETILVQELVLAGFDVGFDDGFG